MVELESDEYVMKVIVSSSRFITYVNKQFRPSHWNLRPYFMMMTTSIFCGLNPFIP